MLSQPFTVLAPVVVCSLVPELACSFAGVSSCLSEAVASPEPVSGVAKAPDETASMRVLDAAADVPAHAQPTLISLAQSAETHHTLKHDSNCSSMRHLTMMSTVMLGRTSARSHEGITPGERVACC